MLHCIEDVFDLLFEVLLFAFDFFGEELFEEIREVDGAGIEGEAGEEGIEIALHFPSILVAFFGIFGEGFEDDGFEFAGEIGFEVGGRIDGALGDGFEDGQFVVAREESEAGDEFVKDDTKAEDIRSAVDLIAKDLFGRHIGNFAFERTFLGLFEAVRGFGDAEVKDLEVAVERDDEILGGDIAVDDAKRLTEVIGFFVGVVQAFARLDDDLDGVFDGEGDFLRLGFEANLGEIAPSDVLHRDKVGLLNHAHIEDLDDMGMIELCSEAGFVEEHGDEAAFFGEVRLDLLDDKEFFKAFGASEMREPDFGHSADGELFDEGITSELLSVRQDRSS